MVSKNENMPIFSKYMSGLELQQIADANKQSGCCRIEKDGMGNSLKREFMLVPAFCQILDTIDDQSFWTFAVAVGNVKQMVPNCLVSDNKAKYGLLCRTPEFIAKFLFFDSYVDRNKMKITLYRPDEAFGGLQSTSDKNQRIWDEGLLLSSSFYGSDTKFESNLGITGGVFNPMVQIYDVDEKDSIMPYSKSKSINVNKSESITNSLLVVNNPYELDGLFVDAIPRIACGPDGWYSGQYAKDANDFTFKAPSVKFMRSLVSIIAGRPE